MTFKEANRYHFLARWQLDHQNCSLNVNISSNNANNQAYWRAREQINEQIWRMVFRHSKMRYQWRKL